jgi:hypothetical protein
MKGKIAAFILSATLSFSGEIDQMWGYLYNHIRGCIRDETLSEEIYKPVLPIRTKEDLLYYLKSLPFGPGYYVIVNTKQLTSSEVCYLRWKLRQLGYSSHFLSPVNILVAAIVPRKADAIYLSHQLKKLVADPNWIYFLPVF